MSLIGALVAAGCLVAAIAPSAGAAPKITVCTHSHLCGLPENQVPIPDELGTPVGEVVLDVADRARVTCLDLGLGRAAGQLAWCEDLGHWRGIGILSGAPVTFDCSWEPHRSARYCRLGAPYPVLVIDDGSGWPR